MEKQEYLELIKKTYEDVISEFKTSQDKEIFDKLLLELVEKMEDAKDEDYDTIFKLLTEDYIKSTEAISKLSPGLATGLYDEKYGITLNTYNGKMSDIPNAEEINENSIFDASSMAKMFTSILLLKEAEKGNIDLNKKFSDYSPLLSNLDVPIIDALRFGANLKTDGRLDEPNISKEERIRRLLNTSVTERDTFIYSDIPYMFVPFLFGDNIEEATENYIKKFYELYRDELGLLQTGYSTVNMTGGTIKTTYDQENNKFIYSQDGLYDPKADIFEREVGLVSGHAGVTTTVKDLEKLMDALSNGLLKEESLKTLTKTVQPGNEFLLDEDGNQILRNEKPIRINHAMGVYISNGGLRGSDISDRYSDSTFAAEGSTGTYSVFDIENGLNATYLSNVRSGMYAKWINTDDYTYGDDNDEMPKNYETTVLYNTHYFGEKEVPQNLSGSSIRPDGTFMTYVRATNNFKEEELETLLKLRIAKEVLIRKANLEYTGEELDEALNEINKAFDQKKYSKENSQDKTI